MMVITLPFARYLLAQSSHFVVEDLDSDQNDT